MSAIAGKTIAYGYRCKSSSSYSVTIGSALSAEHERSYVYGNNTKTTANRQFVWNAISGSTTSDIASKYNPKAEAGTFNINPLNGISGFYIGQDNFIQCVLSAVQMMSVD